jgi:hypothetical protein
MFDKLRLEAARSMHVRDPQGAYQDELIIVQKHSNKKAYIIVDNGYDPERMIFEGSKPQCQAFLKGLKYGAECARADFAAAF